MKTVIFPRTDGDVIIDLREILSDGVIRPALVAVNADGSVKTLGVLATVRDGGGHVEFHRNLIASETGFSRNGDNKLKVHPEGV